MIRKSVEINDKNSKKTITKRLLKNIFKGIFFKRGNFLLFYFYLGKTTYGNENDGI